ncbi:hypothetical protein BKA70DRAFT_1218820 [Coprinopsis sp. MPI-PUGE-AT-0042]|nr:hypothetical protein BKA70DRAFT_1218820 [Coprinopsis sp. MPI-PUGE-AT-0042]
MALLFQRILVSINAGQSFEHTYSGQSMYIYGSAATIQVGLDDGQAFSREGGPLEDDAALYILGWYDGNKPSDGQGDKNVMNATVLERSAEIDFLLFEPSTSWTVSGTTLLLDDHDEWITFSGSWTHTRLYGARQQVAGSVVIDYNIDNNFSNAAVLLRISQNVNETRWHLNRLMFGHSDQAFYGDESAEHTLEVTVKEITGDQMFTLDYLTFDGTPWTNVTSPGAALASPFPKSDEDSPGGTGGYKATMGLGSPLSLAAVIGVISL